VGLGDRANQRSRWHTGKVCLGLHVLRNGRSRPRPRGRTTLARSQRRRARADTARGRVCGRIPKGTRDGCGQTRHGDDNGRQQVST